MIIFRNPGLIDLEAVRTLGVSVKLPNAFGRFGTGIKFGIATVLRGGGEIDIWRGHEVHSLGIVKKTIRDQEFDIVTLDGEPMGITTQLGRDWEPWMVLREFGCNAIDEGGEFMAAPEAIHDGETADAFKLRCLPGVGDDETVIVIDWPELDTAYKLRKELFLEGEPVWQSPKLRILPGPSAHLFYRGVRVFKLEKPSQFTFDILAEQTLTEDRTLLGSYSADRIIRNAFATMEEKELISQAITCGGNYHEAKLDYESLDWEVKPSRAFLDAAMEAREARKSLNESARKVLLKRVRSTAGEETYSGGGYRRIVQDAFSYAIGQLSDIGITFADEQQFITIEEMPSADIMTMLEDGRVYVLRDFLNHPAREIAAELLLRWVDINVSGYGMDDAVRLLAPIIINACPRFKEDEQLAKEDAAEAPPAEDALSEDEIAEAEAGPLEVPLS